jgi:hypothetical protein
MGGGGSTIASSPIGGGGGGGGGGSSWTCAYITIPGIFQHAVAYTPQVGERSLFECTENGRIVYFDIVTYDPGDPLGGLFATERALQLARQQVDPPSPSIRLSPAVDQLVGVPTWLWLDDAWAPVTATASVGAVSATVTATPRSVAWDTGDGTTVTCHGPGRAFSPGRDDAATDCRHTYTRRSTAAGPTATFHLTAAVTYDVAWSATTGDGGDLGTITRSAGADVRVLESQARIR